VSDADAWWHDSAAPTAAPSAAPPQPQTTSGFGAPPPAHYGAPPTHGAVGYQAGYPSGPPADDVSETGGVLAGTGGNAVLSGLFGGLAGGLVGMGLFGLIAELALDLDGDERRAVLVTVVPVCVGILIVAWPDISAGRLGAAVRRSALVAAAAAAAGFVALAALTPLWDSLVEPGESAGAAVAVCFPIITAAIGLAIGAVVSVRKAMFGLVGGALGGALGGLILVAFEGGKSPTFTQLLIAVPLAMTVMGATIGGVERLARKVWIEIVEGPLAGREIILYRKVNTVGSGGACDVVFPDPDVAPRHAEIAIDDKGVTLTVVAAGARTEVNRHAVQSAMLGDGDLVMVGNSYFSVRQR
jgi:MFS family permease